MQTKIIIYIIIGILVVAGIAGASWYFAIRQPALPPVVTPPEEVPPEEAPAGVRTLYTGYVEIDSLSLSEIRTRLEAQGCRPSGYEGETESRCRYRETTVPYDKKNGIKVYPIGYTFGPSSFYLTEDKLWATKDIPGSPDPNKFKEEVRQDVRDMGNIVQIKEDSWKITETKYPWTVIY